jgi:glutamate-1-semialdehyde 2,1-aminomutase/spore coat polysaccharide biosynthesis protein SpsF
MILACGYHGWHDWYIGTTLRRKGVPASTQQMTATFSYGDIENLEKRLSENSGKVAGVIMEALGTTMPPSGYLAQVKETAHRHGALLIFDEIVSGFRIALGGAQQYFGVIPDLACFGKGMANGFPISAIVGPRALMQELDNSFYSFTFGGEAIALAAALATIEVMERENATSQMWIFGRKLKDAYNYLSKRYGLESITWSQGLPPRTVNMFKDADGKDSQLLRSIFQQECIRRGVLFNGAPKICLMHTDRQIEHTICVYDEAFQVLKKALESGQPEKFLHGKPTQPVFRKSDY